MGHGRPASPSRRLAALSSALLAAAGPAAAQSAATIAEADGKGRVMVEIAHYAEDTCMTLAAVREGGPAGAEGPKRTLVVTVTVDKTPGPCRQELRVLRQRIALADRADALSVDVFYVDPKGNLIRVQRPRIYRDLDGRDEAQKCQLASRDAAEPAKC